MNGVLLMGTAAIILMVISKGSVALLVALYGVNVFMTFPISQLGMAKHLLRMVINGSICCFLCLLAIVANAANDSLTLQTQR
jgi:hypothetical protein